MVAYTMFSKKQYLVMTYKLYKCLSHIIVLRKGRLYLMGFNYSLGYRVAYFNEFLGQTFIIMTKIYELKPSSCRFRLL